MKVWNLMCEAGRTGRVIGDAENPQRRASALQCAATIERNGWRVWVEHHQTGKRIFQSELEVAHQKAQ